MVVETFDAVTQIENGKPLSRESLSMRNKKERDAMMSNAVASDSFAPAERPVRVLNITSIRSLSGGTMSIDDGQFYTAPLAAEEGEEEESKEYDEGSKGLESVEVKSVDGYQVKIFVDTKSSTDI